VADLGLAVPTGDRPHRIEGVLSIDRIAVPATWAVASCRRVPADGLSDHDAYVVEVAPT
jgi:hypothetical protein